MPTDATIRVAAAVRSAMLDRGISQTSLAAVLASSQTAVSRRLTGAVPFDIDELTAIAVFLGVPLSDLLAEHRQAS